jgi:tetratricopeptide (TPR) repeat protein
MSGTLPSVVLLIAILTGGPVLIAQRQPPPAPGSTERQSVERAQELIAAGQLDEANQAIRAALRRYPKSGGLYNLLGITAAQQNKTGEAKAAFLQAVAYAPTLIPAYLNLARIQYEQGEQDAAVETYRRVLRLDYNLDEAHGNLAAIFLSKGRYTDAEHQLEALSGNEKVRNSSLAMRCAALAGSGHLEDAQKLTKQFSVPVTEQDVSRAAFTLSKLNQFSLVIQLIEPVLPNGASKELRGLLATAYAQTDQLAQARAAFDAILGEDPRQQQLLLAAARVAYRQNDLEGTASYLLRALDIDKDNPQLQFFFGIVCIRLNLPGDALHALKEAVRLQPDNAPANYALGAAMLTGDKSGNAALYFRKYIQLRPADVHGRFALAVAEFEAGDNGSARRDLLALTENPSVSFGAHYILGKIYRRENDYTQAGQQFLKALKMDEQNPDLHANLAAVYIQQNHLAQAREELERALTLDSKNYLANENLLLLLRKTKDPAAEEQEQKFLAVTEKASDEQKLLLRHIDIQRQNN